MLNQKEEQVCLLESRFEAASHGYAIHDRIRLARLPHFDVCAFILKEMYNFRCRAFPQVVDIGFVGQPDRGDPPAAQITRACFTF